VPPVESTQDLPEPTATGSFAKTPLAHLLVYAYDRELTGTFDFSGPTGQSATVLFIEGQPTKARTTETTVYLGRVLFELGILSEEQLGILLPRLLGSTELHGQILTGEGLISEEQLELALRAQLVRQMQSLVRLPAETTYKYYECFDGLASYGGDGHVGIDPFPVVWACIRDEPPWEHVQVGLSRIGAAGLRLTDASETSRFSFEKSERATVELLRQKPWRIHELTAAATLAPRIVQLLVYCLMVTKQVELVRESKIPGAPMSEEVIPDAPPSTPFAAGVMESVTAPPQRKVARVQLAQRPVTRAPVVVEEERVNSEGSDGEGADGRGYYVATQPRTFNKKRRAAEAAAAAAAAAAESTSVPPPEGDVAADSAASAAPEPVVAGEPVLNPARDAVVASEPAVIPAGEPVVAAALAPAHEPVATPEPVVATAPEAVVAAEPVVAVAPDAIVVADPVVPSVPEAVVVADPVVPPVPEAVVVADPAVPPVPEAVVAVEPVVALALEPVDAAEPVVAPVPEPVAAEPVVAPVPEPVAAEPVASVPEPLAAKAIVAPAPKPVVVTPAPKPVIAPKPAVAAAPKPVATPGPVSARPAAPMAPVPARPPAAPSQRPAQSAIAPLDMDLDPFAGLLLDLEEPAAPRPASVRAAPASAAPPPHPENQAITAPPPPLVDDAAGSREEDIFHIPTPAHGVPAIDALASDEPPAEAPAKLAEPPAQPVAEVHTRPTVPKMAAVTPDQIAAHIAEAAAKAQAQSPVSEAKPRSQPGSEPKSRPQPVSEPKPRPATPEAKPRSLTRPPDLRTTASSPRPAPQSLSISTPVAIQPTTPAPQPVATPAARPSSPGTPAQSAHSAPPPVSPHARPTPAAVVAQTAPSSSSTRSTERAATPLPAPTAAVFHSSSGNGAAGIPADGPAASADPSKSKAHPISVKDEFDDDDDAPPSSRSTGFSSLRAMQMTAELVARKKEIQDKAAALGKEDYYALLGVTRDTPTAEIQKAFFALAKKWHPDRVPPVLADVKDLCAKVFARMSEAHQTLMDPTKRSKYDTAKKPGGDDTPEAQAQVMAILEAATNFQKAEICLRRNDFKMAEDLCKKAIDVEPKQADYISMMAWLQAQKPTKQDAGSTQEQVLELTRAIGISQACERAYFYRAMLLKRLGQEPQAIKDFKRAMELNPRNVDAQREVRLYNMRGGDKAKPASGTKGKEDSGGGIFGKLFKK